MCERIRKMARTIFQKLDCRDLGRLDFRLSDAGIPYFLEINALPSLEQGAGIYTAAALEGLHFDARASTRSSRARRAATRIKDKPRASARPARKGPLRVGFTFNVKRIKPTRRRRRGPRGRVRLAHHAAGHSRGHRQLRPRGGRPRGHPRSADGAGHHPGGRGVQHRRGLPRAGTARARCRRCSSCSTSPTPAPTRRRSRWRSTRRWPRRWCAPRAWTPRSSS